MAGFQDQLENFLEHFDEMQRSSDSDDMFNQEFLALKAQSQQLKDQDQYSTDSGQLVVNKKKNRFKDILPFEYTRVVLPALDGVEGSDYINANYIKGCDDTIRYIAAQGPLPNTVNDFVRMLWHNNTEIIIMACKDVEMGKHKCHQYWAKQNEEVTFGDITIRTTNEENVSNDFVIRDLEVRHGSEEKAMKQYHYTAWPDHGVPISPEPIIRMIEMARDCQRKVDVPVVVHCSAGCGRTGTILAVDYMRSLLLTKSLPEDFSVYGLVEQMRTQRPAMVQAKDQYFFVYMACAELAKRVLGNKPQPPPKNEETISTLRRMTPSQASSFSDIIYENTEPDQPPGDPSPPIMPRQNSSKSHPPPPPAKPTKPTKSTPTPSSSSITPPTPSPQSDTSGPPPPVGVYELVSAPDSPVPKAAPRIKRNSTPQSKALDTKPLPSDDGRRLQPPLPERSSDKDAPPNGDALSPRSPVVGPRVLPRKEPPRTEEKPSPPVPPVKNRSTPKMEGRVEEPPRSAGKSILDTIMDICGTDVQKEAGLDQKEGGDLPPIFFSVDSTDGPDLPVRTPDSMQLIPHATPTTPALPTPVEPKIKGPLPSVPGSSIYEQPTLFSVPASKIPPPSIPSGPSPPSTLSPSSSINAFGASTGSSSSRNSLQTPPATVLPKNSRTTPKVEREPDITDPAKLRVEPRPAVPNMSAGFVSGSGVSVPSGPMGFGVRVGKPRGPRPPPSHWKTVTPVI